MLQFFHKILFACSRPSRPSSRRAQIAVIITVIVAVITLFSIVFINIAKLGQLKTQTSQAADKGALYLASSTGSYSKTLQDNINFQINQKFTDLWSLFLIGLGALIGTVAFHGAVGTAFGMWAGLSFAGGWQASTDSMDVYTMTRERALSTIMSGIVSDEQKVYRIGGDGTLVYQAKDRKGNFYGTTYDLTDTSLERQLKRENRKSMRRFDAWYWSKRYKLVDEGKLSKALDDFVGLLGDEIINQGGAVKWNKHFDNSGGICYQYDAISLPVELGPGQITVDSRINTLSMYGAPSNEFWKSSTFNKNLDPLPAYNWVPDSAGFLPDPAYLGSTFVIDQNHVRIITDARDREFIVKWDSELNEGFNSLDELQVKNNDGTIRVRTIADGFLNQRGPFYAVAKHFGAWYGSVSPGNSVEQMDANVLSSYGLDLKTAGWQQLEDELKTFIWKDLMTFLDSSRELLNMTVNSRMPACDIWIQGWYDRGYAAREAAGGDHDIYDRLTRAISLLDNGAKNSQYWNQLQPNLFGPTPPGTDYLNHGWLPFLIDRDVLCRQQIQAPHGRCRWGKGDVVASATCRKGAASANCDVCGQESYKVYNSTTGYFDTAYRCSTCCNGQQIPCLWQGAYLTCCTGGNDFTSGGQKACIQGTDLYGKKLDWCKQYAATQPECGGGWPRYPGGEKPNCLCSQSESYVPETTRKNGNTIVSGFDYCGYFSPVQGQMSYLNPDAPTILGQSIPVLQKLVAKLKRIRDAIHNGSNTGFADVAYEQLDKRNNPALNNISYVWCDIPVDASKSGPDDLIYHYAAASVSYLNTNTFPSIVIDPVNWIIVTGSMPVVKNATGTYVVRASRYDSDTKTSWWTMRLRKNVSGNEFPKGQMYSLMQEILETGKHTLTGAGDTSEALSKDYVISTTTTCHYGPKKSDIYISR
ncbi:MAG: hypothetical protein ACM3OC_09740 [Deltaproteobacteria bacterium]